MENLHTIALRHGGGKDEHGYCPFYESYLDKFRNKEGIRILELGVSHGNSLRIWKDYFSSPAIICGIDWKMQFFTGDKTPFNLVEMNLRDHTKVQDWASKMGEWDIIIDDAGHHVGDTQKAFDILFPFLKRGGVMFLEDLHTNWLPNANSTGTATTYQMIACLRDKIDFKSEFISAERFNLLKQDVESAQLWARKSGESNGTTNLTGLEIFTINDSITSAIVKK